MNYLGMITHAEDSHTVPMALGTFRDDPGEGADVKICYPRGITQQFSERRNWGQAERSAFLSFFPRGGASGFNEPSIPRFRQRPTARWPPQ